MTTPITTPAEFLAHWQGHRRLTRRVIEAFPEDQLFSFTPTPSLRTFGEMAVEILVSSEMTVDGLLSGDWHTPNWKERLSREQLLQRWDALTTRIDTELMAAPESVYTTRYQLPWDVPPASGWEQANYNVDNEVHHRGQGMVYLRLLGTEPPPFWER